MRLAPYVALVSLRIALVLALMPAPFGDLAPMRIRAALGLLLALVLSIPHFGSALTIDPSPAALIAAAVSELLAGAVIGLTVRVTLAACEIAGTIAGNAMGLGFAGSVDPIFGQESLPTTTVMNSLAVLAFFLLRGHHVVFEALFASLSLLPPGGPPHGLHAAEMVTLGSGMVAQGLRIASPVVATMFIVQLGTGLMARAAPRVQIFALSFGVAVSVGALVLLTSAPQLSQSISHTLGGLGVSLVRVLRGGGP
jgi:flagellar biosynthetic protein FliR